MKKYYVYKDDMYKEPEMDIAERPIEMYMADEADFKIERLEKALKEYGLHHEGCDIWLSEPYNKCNCGFQEALKED